MVQQYLSSEFLINLLILIIVFYFVFKGMMKYLKDRKLSFVIAICASGLTIFYLRYNQEFIVYTTIGYAGFAILFLLPTIIIFHILYKSVSSSGIRKASWIVYGTAMLYFLHNSPFAINPDINKITWTVVITTILLVLLDKMIEKNITIKKGLRPFNLKT